MVNNNCQNLNAQHIMINLLGKHGQIKVDGTEKLTDIGLFCLQTKMCVTQFRYMIML